MIHLIFYIQIIHYLKKGIHIEKTKKNYVYENKTILFV